MTSGNATLAAEPAGNATGGAGDGGANFQGNSDYDATVLRIGLDVPSGRNCLEVEYRFLSEEYPDYVGTEFNDAFIAQLDADEWSVSGSSLTAPADFALDGESEPVAINSVGTTEMSAAEATGTIYGGATKRLEALTPVTAGHHSLYFSIFDQGDDILDSAVMLDDLRMFATGETCGDAASAATTRVDGMRSGASISSQVARGSMNRSEGRPAVRVAVGGA